MDAQTETQGSKQQELDQIMERIREKTEGENESGVTFIKDQDPKKPEVQAANKLYDGLGLAIQIIAEDSELMANSEDPKAKEYESVLRAIEPIALALSSLADNKIPLTRAKRAEEVKRLEGDNVRIFTAGDFNLEGTPFEFLSVFIRPDKFIRSSTIAPKNNPNRPNLRPLLEVKQPRMALRAVPRNNPYGFLEIRLDREDLERELEITYDIEIGEGDLLSGLNFSDQAGQREGHHFNSGFTTESLGVSFSQILTAMGDKVERAAVTPVGLGNK